MKEERKERESGGEERGRDRARKEGIKERLKKGKRKEGREGIRSEVPMKKRSPFQRHKETKWLHTTLTPQPLPLYIPSSNRLFPNFEEAMPVHGLPMRAKREILFERMASPSEHQCLFFIFACTLCIPGEAVGCRKNSQALSTTQTNLGEIMLSSNVSACIEFVIAI